MDAWTKETLILAQNSDFVRTNPKKKSYIKSKRKNEKSKRRRSNLIYSQMYSTGVRSEEKQRKTDGETK